MAKKVIKGFLVLGGLMISLGISYAGIIEVGGDRSGTWSTGNTYVVTSTVTIPPGLKLTVEPGVIVKFSTNTSLVIYGELIASGTLNGTITFTSNNIPPQPGDWNSIKFSGGQSKGTISYCLIEYGKQAIYLENTSKITITHNTVRNNTGVIGEAGGYLVPGETGGVGAGIYLSVATNNTIISNIIYNNQGGQGGHGGYSRSGGGGGIGAGIYLNSSTNNTITGNTINNNQGGQGGVGYPGGQGEIGAGIYLNSSTNNTITSNTINNNQGGQGGNGDDGTSGGQGGIGTGIYLASSTNNILQSNIIFNNQSGQFGFGVGYNSGSNGIPGNGYGIYIDSNSYNNTIDCNNTYNGEPIYYYYGITTPTTIEYQTLTLTGSGSTNLGRIVLINCSNFSIRNNFISGGIGKNGYTGYPGGQGGIGAGIYLSASTNITIIDNTINNNQGGQGGTGGEGGQGGIGAGIYLSAATNITIAGNIINNNQGGQGGTGGRLLSGGQGGIGAGIYLSAATNITITGNTINNNQGGQGGTGGYNVSGSVGGNGYGIYLDLADNNIIRDNNTIKDNIGGNGNPNGIGVGIYCKSSVVSSLIYNNIYNNQTYNLQTDISPNTQTAEYNWWGADPPATSTFSGNIDYEPWLTTFVPKITIVPSSGTIGTFITVSGEDFISTELIRIDFGITLTITTAITDSLGKFTTVFTVDTQPYGTTSIIAVGLTSGMKATGSFFITGGRIYLLTPASGTVGTKVTIAGNGYGRTEGIVIHFGTIRSIATCVASDAGIFSTTFTFPLMVRGTKTIIATGLKTQVETNAFFNVLGSTRLEIKPESKILSKGDEFVLDVWLKDVVNLAGLDTFLDFDPNLLEVLDDNPAQDGIQITQGGFPPQASLLYAGATNTTGQIAYSVILVPATNTATGEGILARIRFKAKAKGTATISFAFDTQNNRWTVLKDGENQPIPITTYGGTVTVYEYGNLEGYVVIDPPKGTGTNAGISVTLVGVEATNTIIGGYYSFPEVVPGTYTIQADTSGVAPGTITGIRVFPGTKTTVATLTLLNGDSNNDGVVDIEDFMVLRNTYLTVEGDGRWNEEADYNGDKKINIEDAMILRASFFKAQPTPPAPAPPIKLPVQTAKTKLIFSPSVINTFVGATFSVQVVLEDVEDLAACQVQLSFDVNLLEVVNIADGSLNLPVLKSQTGAGTIDYAYGLLEGQVSGSGVLAEITFKVQALIPVQGYIRFDFNPTTHRMTKMLNTNSQAILFDANEVKVNIKPMPALDHFGFEEISSPKAQTIPFKVTIKAMAQNNVVDSAYNEKGTLTLHNIAGTITPQVITFGSGTWQGTVTISGTGTNVFITIKGAGNKVGTSNLFDVQAINVPNDSNEDIVIKSEDEKVVVVIEKDSPNQDAYIEIKKVTIPTTPPPPNIPQDISPVVIEIKVVTAGDVKLEIKGSITLTYTDEQVKGLDESRLRIFYYNGSSWELASEQQEVDTINNRIIAYNITHFSIYGIGSLVAPNLANVQVYPNPFKPTTIHQGKYVTFKNLTSYWNLKIFNLAGELVDEKAGDTNEAHWDGKNQAGNKVASGVYIYLITNDKNEKVTGRVVVIR